MKAFKINDDRYLMEDINIILINQEYWFGGTLYYFITVFEKNGSFSYFKTRSFEDAKNTIKLLFEFLKSHGAKNLACLDNEFIINMDNLKSLDHLTNLAGSNKIEAIFKNGNSFALYQGPNRNYANFLLKSYNIQEEQYSHLPNYKKD